MPEQTGRLAWVLKFARAGLIVSVVLVALMLAATVALAIVTAIDAPFWLTGGGPRWITIGSLAAVALAELAACIWLFVCYGVVRILLATELSSAEIVARLSRTETLLEDQVGSIHKLTELAALTDRAKSLLFRKQEIDAIHETIHENLIRQDYQSAEMLIDSIEKTFGYADEAARLREEVKASRKATLAEKIDAAVDRIREMITRYDWDRAKRETSRIIELFPDNAKIASLPERIESARARHKRDLLQAYGEAVRKNDVDRSIALLKELDLYLTPQEGAALAESARGVFRARLHQLGVQFAIAVTEMQWAEAVGAGETIIREYPNTRMAQEVREKLDLLKERAAQPQPGPSAASPEQNK